MSQKSKSISEKAKQGVVYTTIARLSGTFMQFAGSVVLARLLAVQDFGVVQMSMMVIGFATKLGEFGFNMGLVQRKEEVRPEHVNSLFVLDFAFKVTLFVIIVLATPYLVNYFHEPRLRMVLPAIALYMVLDCFSNPGTTMLERQMNFKKQTQIQMTERFIEIVSSVIMALCNFQIWSLVLSKILAISVAAVLASRAAGWRPSLKIDFQASKDLFVFGGWVFIKNLCRYMADHADQFFISRYLGAQPLGYYTKAFDLMRLPQRRITRAVNSVLFAAFARVQDEPEKVKAGFQKVVLAVSLASYPLLVGMMVVAPEFVRLVYGEKWLPMVIPLQIMCIAGILRSLDPFLNSVVTATGFVKHTAFRRFVELGLLAVATYIGVKFGINGVSTAVVIVSIVVMVLMVNLLKRVSMAGWRDYLGSQLPAIGASLAMAAVMLAFRYFFAALLGPNSFWLLAGMILIGAVTYLGALWLTRPQRVVELLDEASSDLQKMKNKTRKKIAGIFARLGLVPTILK